MNQLRADCPWDRKQTIETLRQQTLEEVYELVESIDEKNWKGLKEELGDVLLHILFYSKIAEEKNEFNINDVIEAISNKLISRHPHIYSIVKLETEQEVKENWEKLKLSEGKESILSGVPTALPAIIKALRLQEKTKKVGFEWEHIHQVKEKLDEELIELNEAINFGEKEKIEEEFGDVFFTLINYSRFLNIDPDFALEKTNKKFIRRFQAMEQLAKQKNKQLDDLNLAEMDLLWNEVKSKE